MINFNLFFCSWHVGIYFKEVLCVQYGAFASHKMLRWLEVFFGDWWVTFNPVIRWCYARCSAHHTVHWSKSRLCHHISMGGLADHMARKHRWLTLVWAPKPLWPLGLCSPCPLLTAAFGWVSQTEILVNSTCIAQIRSKVTCRDSDGKAGPYFVGSLLYRTPTVVTSAG